MIPKDFEHIQHSQRFFNILARSYNYLFAAANKKGHWDELRSTALVGLCLILHEEKNSMWLTTVKNWIESKQDKENGCWGEEIWDTGMCLIFLIEMGLGYKYDAVNKAHLWLMKLYSTNKRFNWHDEPWETFWGLISILHSKHIPPALNLDRTLEWYCLLQDASGRIVAPHYTVYFLMLYSYIAKNKLISSYEKYSQAALNCESYLCAILNGSDDILWTGEAWSNGQMLWMITTSGNCNLSEHDINKVLLWFEEHQDPDGGYGDVEDTACAILGIYSLLKYVFKTDYNFNSVKLCLQSMSPAPKLILRNMCFERNISSSCISVHISNKVAAIFCSVVIFILSTGLLWYNNIHVLMKNFIK